jgi:RNA polymerase sigma-70 factor (ECF subfamily)
MSAGAAAGGPDGEALLERLRRGDETAFRLLVRQHHTSMVSFASGFLRDRSAAEEAVQDSWIAVLSGIGAFEGRSSLKSWMFAIVANKARTKARRDGRMVPFADFGAADEPAVDAERFTPEGSWDSPPASWSDINPERIVAGRQLLAHVMAILETLPAAQRTVVRLRDLEGLSAPDVCEVLQISEANQRILLHRGRSRVRQGIDSLLADDKSPVRTPHQPAGGARTDS